MSDNKQLPGPATETTRAAPREGRRRKGAFELQGTRPPERGLSVGDAMAELARRRTTGEPGQRRRRPAAEVYTAPDGSRIPIPGPAAPPSLIQPQPAPQPQPTTPPLAPTQGAPAAPAPAPLPTTPPAPAPVQAPALAAGDPNQPVAVIIDGQTASLPLGELVHGYLRQRDYSIKTQQAATQLKAAQDAHAQFKDARERLEQRLAQVIAADGDEFAKPIDWVALSKSDPIGYSQKHARWLARQEALAEQGRLADLRQKEEAGRKSFALATGHQALCQIIPQWNDPAQRGALQARMLQHLKLRGFTDDEIGKREMIDPREVVMLLESVLWAQHISQGLPAPAPGTPTLPGNGRAAGDGRPAAGGAPPADVTAADERFGRTGKLDDGLALLKARRRAAGQA